MALLGLTALEVLTQLCSIQGATLLPDLVTQHASLMQLDMLPLDNASLSLATLNPSALQGCSLALLDSTAVLGSFTKLALQARSTALLHNREAAEPWLHSKQAATSPTSDNSIDATPAMYASSIIHRLSASMRRRPKDVRLQLASHVGGVSARLQ